ncbi:hypothetical protein OUZ56_020634 [Daphnia magna]|uniref:Uncharacterized protein n=1 Tax=Daphnia magna TaxID=35525 RepID=A0ABQ9ZG32_9CRUS|nr:hypothetical protein OUZ56_020634 [Daphnia magna]
MKFCYVMQHGLLLIVELSVSENHLDRINSQNISVTEKYVKKCSETSTQEWQYFSKIKQAYGLATMKAVNPGTKPKDKPNMKHLLYKQHTACRFHLAMNKDDGGCWHCFKVGGVLEIARSMFVKKVTFTKEILRVSVMQQPSIGRLKNLGNIRFINSVLQIDTSPLNDTFWKSYSRPN